MLEGRQKVKYPSTHEWKKFFKRMPRWIIALIIVLLFGRFVLIAVWHWLYG
jgi:hypothetical protein